MNPPMHIPDAYWSKSLRFSWALVHSFIHNRLAHNQAFVHTTQFIACLYCTPVPAQAWKSGHKSSFLLTAALRSIQLTELLLIRK